MTKLAIISDTHDDIVNVIIAVDLFRRKKIEYIIHAGDYIFPGILKEFGKLANVKFVGVFGNNDGEKLGLLKNANEINGELKGEFGEILIDGLKIGVYHGTNRELTDCIIKSGLYDVFVYGHTHKKYSAKIGKTIVLNPGTAHGNFPNIDGVIEKDPMIIIFDTDTKSYDFIPISKDEDNGLS